MDPWIVSRVCQMMFGPRDDNSGSAAWYLMKSYLHAITLWLPFGRWQWWWLLCWPASLKTVV
jgi:hypothetical protein